MLRCRKIKTLFLLLVVGNMLLGQSVYAQQPDSPDVKNPPVNVETLFSNRGMAFQMVVDKDFQNAPRFGFFTLWVSGISAR